MQNKKTVAIVANDAGGAEILSSWVLRNNYDYIFVLKGPAKSIFSRKIPNIETNDLYSAIDKCDWVLTETGSSNDLNYEAILTSKKKGKYVVAFLDHWSDYIERFTSNNISIFPDEIWAGDIDCYNLARTTFPQILVKLKDNPYWKDILENYEMKNPISESVDFLYVSSNFDNQSSYRGQDNLKISDILILDKIIKKIAHYANPSINIALTIRPHPSEDLKKYSNFSSPDMEILYDNKSDIVDSILRHRYVVGTNSMALVIGKILGKTTINAILKDNISTLPDKFVDHTILINV